MDEPALARRVGIQARRKLEEARNAIQSYHRGGLIRDWACGLVSRAAHSPWRNARRLAGPPLPHGSLLGPDAPVCRSVRRVPECLALDHEGR